MKRRISSFRNGIIFMACAVLGLSSAAIAATIMNGKEVKQHIGHIVSHNERSGEIVIKTDKSTGNWRLSPHVVILSGKQRLSLPEIWTKTKRVQVFVSTDGEVQRINVLEWK